MGGPSDRHLTQLLLRISSAAHVFPWPKRLRHNAVKGEYAAEIRLVNSHERSSAYQLHGGLFRFVCVNGMMLSDGVVNRVSIRHSGFTPEQVIDASFQLLDQVPQITASVDAFRARRLTPAESKAFAESALLLRCDDLAAAPVGPEKLLAIRRHEDVGDDLWRTLNRLTAFQHFQT